MPDDAVMTPDEARIVLLEDTLDQTINQIEFMHGCLTAPERFSYAYPQMTTDSVRQWRELVPGRPMCVHSTTVPDCPSCTHRIERGRRLAEARAVLEAIRG